MDVHLPIGEFFAMTPAALAVALVEAYERVVR